MAGFPCKAEEGIAGAGNGDRDDLVMLEVLCYTLTPSEYFSPEILDKIQSNFSANHRSVRTETRGVTASNVNGSRTDPSGLGLC